MLIIWLWSIRYGWFSFLLFFFFKSWTFGSNEDCQYIIKVNERKYIVLTFYIERQWWWWHNGMLSLCFLKNVLSIIIDHKKNRKCHKCFSVCFGYTINCTKQWQWLQLNHSSWNWFFFASLFFANIEKFRAIKFGG